MGIHEKAWSGINILIYGKTPTLPMKLEQAIAKLAPFQEIRIESFEDYNDAYNFCKTKQSVGLIFVLDNCGELPIHSVFSQLAIPYETKGWPCFGVIVAEKKQSIMGFRAKEKNKNIFKYIESEEILDSHKTVKTMEEIWVEFIQAFEQYIAPKRLQDTLFNLVQSKYNNDSLRFCDRIKTVISSNLNISWIENIAIRWFPIVRTLEVTNPDIIKSIQELKQITSLASEFKGIVKANEIFESKNNLCSKVANIITFLNQERLSGNLEESLKLICTLNKPGAPAIIRHIAKNREIIIKIAFEEDSLTKLENIA